MPCCENDENKRKVNSGLEIAKTFQGNDEVAINVLLKCFECVHFEYCKKVVLSMVYIPTRISEYKNSLCKAAFYSALNTFLEKIKKNGFAEMGAKITTFFLPFFRLALFKEIKDDIPPVPWNKVIKSMDNDEPIIDDPNENNKSKINGQTELFEKALLSLSEANFLLIIIGKFLKPKHKLKIDKCIEIYNAEISDKKMIMKDARQFTYRLHQAMQILKVKIEQ